MSAKHTQALVPCPLCGKEPERFFVGPMGFKQEVIACQKGCKPNWNSWVVHIRSDYIEGNGWKDLGDAWNTIEVYTDEEGDRRVRFDLYPKGYRKPEPDGPHLKWSPEISARIKAERAAHAKATGENA